MKLSESQMRTVTDGARRSGLAVTEEPFEAFFVGRNPG
jgi:hypothetical protein